MLTHHRDHVAVVATGRTQYADHPWRWTDVATGTKIRRERHLVAVQLATGLVPLELTPAAATALAVSLIDLANPIETQESK